MAAEQLRTIVAASSTASDEGVCSTEDVRNPFVRPTPAQDALSARPARPISAMTSAAAEVAAEVAVSKDGVERMGGREGSTPGVSGGSPVLSSTVRWSSTTRQSAHMGASERCRTRHVVLAAEDATANVLDTRGDEGTANHHDSHANNHRWEHLLLDKLGFEGQGDEDLEEGGHTCGAEELAVGLNRDALAVRHHVGGISLVWPRLAARVAIVLCVANGR